MERLEQYFSAWFEGEKKQQAILLGVRGSKTYRLIRDLLQPQKPGDVGLKEILEKLESHFSPKRNSIAGIALKGKMLQSSSQDSEGFESIASSEQHLKTCCQINSFVESATITFNEDCWVLSLCTGTQEPIQKTKQYTTANQWLLNKERTMVIRPLWTGTPGQNPKGTPAPQTYCLHCFPRSFVFYCCTSAVSSTPSKSPNF